MWRDAWKNNNIFIAEKVLVLLNLQFEPDIFKEEEEIFFLILNVLNAKLKEDEEGEDSKVLFVLEAWKLVLGIFEAPESIFEFNSSQSSFQNWKWHLYLKFSFHNAAKWKE